MNHSPRFFKRFDFCIYTYSNDQWIGRYISRKSLQDSDCKFIQTTHYICIIPCIVIEFTTKKFTVHKKGCWHKK